MLAGEMRAREETLSVARWGVLKEKESHVRREKSIDAVL